MADRVLRFHKTPLPFFSHLHLRRELRRSWVVGWEGRGLWDGCPLGVTDVYLSLRVECPTPCLPFIDGRTLWSFLG